MEGGIDRSTYSQGLITDYYSLESHLLSTRSADLYKAVEKAKGRNVALWMLRHPLAPQSPAVDRFFSRISKFMSLGAGFPTVLASGMDSTGAVFCAMRPLDGYPVGAGNLEFVEAERRLTTCYRLTEQIHTNGLVCGDLCGGSFWVTRTGEIVFIGIMGSFDSEAVATSMAPPLDTLHFVSPEQRSGGGYTEASDVYSLGVLTYFLLTRRYPGPETSSPFVPTVNPSDIVPPSQAAPGCPSWADEIIPVCLDPNPQKRYPSASALTKAIMEARQRFLSSENTPVLRGSRAGVIRQNPQEGKAVQIRTDLPMQRESEEVPQQGSSYRKYRLLGAAVLFGILLVIALARGKAKDASNQLADELKSHQGSGDPAINKAIEVLSENDADLKEKEAKFNELKASDDPLAHEILVKSAVEASSSRIRSLAEGAIVDRARRHGLVRASSEVKLWLRNLAAGEKQAAYEPVLRSLDSTLPIEARSAAIRQAYATVPALATKLTAALALDSPKADEYQPVLSQLVGDSLHLEDGGGRSVLALILAHPELSKVFSEDVVQRRAQISNEDVLWLLKVLAGRGDVTVRALAASAVERKILSPIRLYHLELIRDRGDLPQDIVVLLVRAASGTLEVSDIKKLGGWFDLVAEQILFAICADDISSEVQTEAFDYVSGKTLSAEPQASLVNWLRTKAWEKRSSLVRVIGMVSFPDRFTPDELSASFDSLAPFIKDSPVLDLILDSNNPIFAKIALAKYGKSIDLGRLLTLLDSPDRDVRIAAIGVLKETNDVGALKIVIDHYEAEVDAAVRDAYKQNFWVIKERGD